MPNQAWVSLGNVVSLVDAGAGCPRAICLATCRVRDGRANYTGVTTSTDVLHTILPDTWPAPDVILNTGSYRPGVVNVHDTTEVPVVAKVPIPTIVSELLTMIETVHVEFIVVSCPVMIKVRVVAVLAVTLVGVKVAPVGNWKGHERVIDLKGTLVPLVTSYGQNPIMTL